MVSPARRAAAAPFAAVVAAWCGWISPSALAQPAVSADVLRHLAGEAERGERLRARRVDPLHLAASLAELLVAAPPKPTAAKPPAAQQSAQQSAPPPAPPKPAPPKPAPPPAAAQQRAPPAPPSYVYQPPARNRRGASNSVDASKPRSQRFGIRLGTWITARLPREANSADSGLTEIRVTEPVTGDRRTLPAGTIVFADKRFNSGTRRLDLIVRRGLLPDGEEFKMHGLVHDRRRQAGLPGHVARRSSQGADALTGALSQTGDAMIRGHIATPARPLVAAVKRLIAGEPPPKTAFTVRASAQDLLIQVQDSF